jgi:hypothetical protein
MDDLCISGTKGAAYSQSLTKGTASLLSGTNRWTASVSVGQRGRPIPKVLPKGRPLNQDGPTDGRPLYQWDKGGGLFPKSHIRDGLSVKWDQQMDGLCISGQRGRPIPKVLPKGTASAPSGTNRWTTSVLVGPRGRPIPKVLPKGRPLCQVGPTDGLPLY